MMPTSENCFEDLKRKSPKITTNSVWHLVGPHQIVFLHSNMTSFILSIWCLWHYHNSMTSRENGWTCNTSRNKHTCPWCESLSVTAVCGGGCVMELGKRKSIIAQLAVNWVGTDKHILNPFPCISRVFPSFHIPLYSMCCLILLLFLTVEHQRRYGLWATETGSSREEPSVMLNLLERFLEQEWRDQAPSLGHFR